MSAAVRAPASRALAVPYVGYGLSRSLVRGSSGCASTSMVASSVSTSSVLPTPSASLLEAPSVHVMASNQPDYRVSVPPIGRRVSRQRQSIVSPIDRSHLRRRSTTVHRVTVELNVVRSDGEVDDDRCYHCSYCGARVSGSVLMRLHLQAKHRR